MTDSTIEATDEQASTLTFTEAAEEVLRTAGKPLHYKEITELAIEKNLLSHVGKNPEVTMGARLAALIKKEDKSVQIVRVRPGVFALRKMQKGQVPAAGEEQEVNALEVEATQEMLESVELSSEDAKLVDLATNAAEQFEEEQDDDQPILEGEEEAAEAQGEAKGGDGRRRRRRRGRTRRDGEGVEASSGEGGVDSVEPETLRQDRGDGRGDRGDGRGDRNGDRNDGRFGQDRFMQDRFRDSRDSVEQRYSGRVYNPTGEINVTEGDELAGRELADAALVVLNAFDRTQGPVSLRAVAEQLSRRGRLPNDVGQACTMLSASLRADNLRRSARSERQRFRFAVASRVAPTDWSLQPELVKLEQDAMLAIERYREGARKAMLRKLQDLQGHSFTELVLLTLERLGMTSLRPVRRQGLSGGEAHYTGILRSGIDEIRTAIVIRKDGREISRERVADLRGSLHHYGGATSCWLVTTGQVLSGAREEASIPGAAPTAVYDGLSFCRLLDETGVATTRTTVHIGIPDVEFLEMLRGI
jgi:HB1, ASXL, restriction endonuclease HTH domain/Restriction endonuclease